VCVRAFCRRVCRRVGRWPESTAHRWERATRSAGAVHGQYAARQSSEVRGSSAAVTVVGTPNQPMRQYAMKRFPCPYERRRGNRNHSHPPADAAPLGIAPQTRGRPATTTAVEGHSLPFLHPSISSGAPSWKELANLLWATWGFTLHKLRVHCASPDCTTQAVRRSTDTVGAMCVVGMHLDRHGRVSATKPGMRKADEIASRSNRIGCSDDSLHWWNNRGRGLVVRIRYWQ
jgi:hypothetical protein